MSVQTSTRYLLRIPNAQRKSYKIVKREYLVDGSTQDSTLSNKDIEALNISLKQGKVSEKNARIMAEAIKDRLNEKIGVLPFHKNPANKIANKANEDLLERYFEATYADRYIEDEASAKGELHRALRAVGNTSLISASQGELGRVIKNLPFGATKKRRIISKINQLLRFANRDFKLSLPKKERKLVKFLTNDEYQILRSKLSEDCQALADIAYLSGARLGEVYAMRSSNYSNNQVLIAEQIVKTKKKKTPKWGSIRPAYAFTGLEDAINRKENLEMADLLPSRDRLYREIKKAARESFQKSQLKQITFHDLRHSYAKRLLDCGVNISLVAQSLGNSVTVCQEHYVGYTLSDGGLEMIAKIVNG